MSEEIEKIKIEGVNIQDLLSEKFINLVEKEGLNLDFIGITFFSKNKKVIGSLLHENSEEIGNKIIHVKLGNQELIKKISNILEKL